jgi:hypothetical protein
LVYQLKKRHRLRRFESRVLRRKCITNLQNRRMEKNAYLEAAWSIMFA